MAHSRAQLAAVAKRRTKLIEYRRKKIPYAVFYEELGYASADAARRDFNRALEESIATQHASIEVYRQEQLEELEYLAEEVHKVFRSQHFVTSASGRIVTHPATGEPLVDPQPRMAAADRLLKILAEVAKLRGVYAPQKLEVMTIDAIDAAIADLHAQLAAADPEAEALAGTEGTAD